MSRHGGPATIYRHGSNNFRPKNVDTTQQPVEEAPSLSSRPRVKKAVARVPEYRLPASSSIEQLSRHAQTYSAPQSAPRVPNLASTPNGSRQPLSATKATQGGERLQKQKSTYTITSAKVAKAAARVNPVKVSIASLREAAYSPVLEAKSPSTQPISHIPVEDAQSSPSIQATHRSDSAARFEAFLTRTGRADSASKGNPHELYASRRRSQSLSRLQTRPPPSTPVLDERKDSLDTDFLVQFIKDHQLAPELAAAVQKELSGWQSPPGVTASPPSKAISTFGQTADSVSRTPHQPSSVSAKSPLLSPAGKPPRPPRSERRVSHSPVIPSPIVPPDRDVRERHHAVISSQTVPATSMARKASLTGSQGKRESKGQTRRDRDSTASISKAQNKTPPTAHFARTFGSPHSEEIAQAIAVVEQGQEQEDYERDRRLSSLLRGLGIQGVGEHLLDRQILPRRKSRESAYFPKEEADEEIWPTHARHSTIEREVEVKASRRSTDATNNRPPSLPRRSSRRSSNNLKRKGSQRSSIGTHADARRESQRTSLGLADSVLAGILPSLDSTYRASFGHAEQRSSMSISDSVLASILASESFCLPRGARLSMEQIAARLSIEVTNALKRHSQANGERYHRDSTAQRSRSEVSLQPFIERDTLQYSNSEEFGPFRHSVIDEPEEMWEEQQFIVAPTDEERQYSDALFEDSWKPSTDDVILREDGAEADYTNAGEFTFGSIYPEESLYVETEPQPIQPFEEADFSIHQQEKRNPFYSSLPAEPQDPEPTLVQSPQPEAEVTTETEYQEPLASLLSPIPAAIPHTEEAGPPESAQPLRRKRTLSTNYLQRLSSTFTSSSSSKTSRSGRKRLPSIFGGLSSKTLASGTDQEVASLRAASPVPSVASIVAAQPQAAAKRKRALTGPARLIDIANAVTNSPSFSQLGARETEHQPLSQVPICDNTWRATIPEAMLQELIRVHTPQELQRQEVIWELCRTEESFVTGLRGVIKVFSSPLRDQQGCWISGIPIMVTRLFGWLDDIVYFHSHLQAILTRTRSAQGLLTIRIAEAFLPMIPRLEIHQAYLSRFEQVTRAIEDMILAPESEFGEFVRMQQALPECGSMTLSSFLLKPVQRLMKYPLFFKQLCQLTPPAHPDFEATALLYQITDDLIRAMQEVKAREEDYEHICSLVRKIHGLPTGMELGKRDRRLLAAGPLKQIHLNERDVQALAGGDSHASMYGASPGADSGVFISPRPASIYSEASSSGLSEGRGYALSPASVSSGGTRPNSINSSLRPESMLSYTSALSGDSYATMSSASTLHPQYQTGSLSGLSPSSSVSTAYTPHLGNRRILKARGKETAIQIFVFSDLVVFATRQTEGFRIKSGKRQAVKEEKSAKYCVVSDWGVAKIIGIRDLTGRTDHDNLLQLDLLPIWSDKEVTQSSLWNAAMATSILISVPVATLATQDAKDKELHYYLEALQQSYVSSLKSLSFSNEPTASSQNSSHTGRNGDCHYVLPRSPSEREKTRYQDNLDPATLRAREAEDEREERQWWSARLKKVQQEMEEAGPDTTQDALPNDLSQHVRAEELRQAEERKQVILMEASKRLERKMSSNSLRVGLAISYDDEERQEQQRGVQMPRSSALDRTATATLHNNSRLAVSAIRRPC